MTLKPTTHRPGETRPAARPTTWHTAGTIFAGLLVLVVALAAWALSFVLGGRPVLNDLLHRDIGGSTGIEIALAGVFAFGAVFIIGLGWSIGTRTGREK